MEKQCGHLFNGIGGFALAAHWMGWQNAMHCEIDPFCNKVMNHHFPNSQQHEDIRTTDFTIWQGRINLLTGGFPCQPYSAAGKRKGKEDDRHLWPEMLRAIQEIQPGWIVGENVRGLINWNGGMVFDEVFFDLETEGYEIFPVVLPAASVNAPHRRERIWFIAHANNFNRGTGTEWKDREEINNSNSARIIANADSDKRSKGRLHEEGPEQAKRHIGTCHAQYSRNTWQNFPTQSPICSGHDGLSSQLDGITFSKWRTESLKAAGNAIVPQIAYQIFKIIEKMEMAGRKITPA